MTTHSKLARHNSCVVCFAGDTLTGLLFRGEPEWAVAGFWRLGVPKREARQMILDIARDRYGCDAGTVPTHEIDVGLRVCTRCAAKAGMKVGDVDQGLPVYERQEPRHAVSPAHALDEHVVSSPEIPWSEVLALDSSIRQAIFDLSRAAAESRAAADRPDAS